MPFVLVTALVTGSVVGLAGRLVPAWRGVPLWLPVAVGVLAAAAGALAARSVGATAPGPAEQIVVQLFFAGVGVLVMGLTTARRASER